MARKSAEGRVQGMFRPHNIYAWKIHDWTPGTGKVPGCDFTLSPVVMHFEVKQTNASGYFPLEYVTQTERSILDRYNGWMFFELGIGRAPFGKDGYMIPWEPVYKQAEAKLIAGGHKSFQRLRSPQGIPGADELFPEEYKLIWAYGNWYIPDEHPFWTCTVSKLEEALSVIRTKLSGVPHGYAA